MNKLYFQFLLILGLLLGGSAFAVQAQSYPTSFVVESSSGQEVTPVNTIDKITFSGGKIQVARVGEGTISTDLRSIQKCYFSNKLKPTGILTILDQVMPTYVVYHSQGLLHILGLEVGKRYRVGLYSSTGETLLSRDLFTADDALDVSRLAGGLYIVTIDEQSIKFIKD